MAKGKYEKWLEPDNIIRIVAWARDGLSDAQIAHNMGISCSTLREWRKNYPAISAALKKGKEVVDVEVENALFKRATGYDYEETVEELRYNQRTGQMELMVTKRTKKHMPPNVAAIIFWLKNRRPDIWRNLPASSAEVEDLSEIEAEIYGDPKKKNH